MNYDDPTGTMICIYLQNEVSLLLLHTELKGLCLITVHDGLWYTYHCNGFHNLYNKRTVTVPNLKKGPTQILELALLTYPSVRDRIWRLRLELHSVRPIYNKHDDKAVLEQRKIYASLGLEAVTHFPNKAIRDSKYLALPHSSAWQRSPHFCCDVISLLARVFIFLIDRATQEVTIKNIWKK